MFWGVCYRRFMLGDPEPYMRRMNHQELILWIATLSFEQRGLKQVGVHPLPSHVIVTDFRVQAARLECGGFSAPL